MGKHRGYEKGYTDAPDGSGRIVETSQQYEEYDGFDANLNIVTKRKNVGEIIIYDDEPYEEEEKPVWCKHCLSYGFRVRMLVGQRILMVGEQRPPDFDQFLNCPDCSNVIAIHEVEKEASIKDTVETVDNPFDQGKDIIVGAHEKITRKTMSKRARKGRRRSLRGHHKDPEIDALLRIYGDRVNVVMDSDP